MNEPVYYGEKNTEKLFINSLNDLGFSILDNAPISPLLLEEVFSKWAEFFNSPEKYFFLQQGSTIDGYFPYGVEKAKPGKIGDLKEYFYYYPWGKCPKQLKECTDALHSSLLNLGSIFLAWVYENLPNQIKDRVLTPFSKMIHPVNRAVLRIIHYPPLQNFSFSEHALYKNQILRASEHEDLTLFSLLPSTKEAGLELKDKNGNWHAIKHNKNTIIVNIGDMLTLCTRGHYKATTHRVSCPIEEINKSRFSIAFFLNPCNEAQLDEDNNALTCMQKHLKKKFETPLQP